MLVFHEVFCNYFRNQRCLDTTGHSVVNRMMLVLETGIVQRGLVIDD
jgi:hypothetical protein